MVASCLVVPSVGSVKPYCGRSAFEVSIFLPFHLYPFASAIFVVAKDSLVLKRLWLSKPNRNSAGAPIWTLSYLLFLYQLKNPDLSCLFRLMTNVLTGDNFPLFADSSKVTGCFFNQWKNFCHRRSEFCTVALCCVFKRCIMPYWYTGHDIKTLTFKSIRIARSVNKLGHLYIIKSQFLRMQKHCWGVGGDCGGTPTGKICAGG